MLGADIEYLLLAYNNVRVVLTLEVSEAEVLMIQGQLATATHLAHQIVVVALWSHRSSIAITTPSDISLMRDSTAMVACILGSYKIVTLPHHWENIIRVRKKVYSTGASEIPSQLAYY